MKFRMSFPGNHFLKYHINHKRKKKKKESEQKKNLYATKSLLCKADKMITVFKQQHH